MDSLYFILLTGLPVLLIITGVTLNRKADQRFAAMVKRLFADSEKMYGRVYRHSQTVDLPEPVQRYFRTVLREGQPLIASVRLRHTGEFRTGANKKWMPILGEEYFTVVKPGMVWKGKTKLFTAYDSFLSGKGRLEVFLFSILRIANGQGYKYSQGEMLRWLGEAAWFPTALLPCENLKWTAIDGDTAKLSYKYHRVSGFYIVSFSETGKITQIETKRYRNGKNLETWIGKFSDYERHHDILIPTRLEGIWRLAQGDLSYAKFKLKEIQYNIPEQFQ